MPGARWFPDARLNFAENLLARRAADDAGDALVFRGEDKVARRISHARAVATRVARRGRTARGVSAGRSGRRLPAEHARGDRRDAGRDQPRRRLVIVLARFRRPRRARPLRPDRAQGALHGRRLLVQRQTAVASRQGRDDRRAACRASSAWSSCPTSSGGGRASTSVDRPRRHRLGRLPRRRMLRSRSSTRGCRSTTRSTSCTRRAPPACRSASFTARAARCSSISRNIGCTATSGRATGCSTSRPAAG